MSKTGPIGATELKWVDEPASKIIRPPLNEFENFEERTFTSVFIKKAKQNILVPLGLLATSACLVMGLVNLKRGDSHKQQFYMRGRVAFQGLTLAAMIYASVSARRAFREERKAENAEQN